MLLYLVQTEMLLVHVRTFNRKCSKHDTSTKLVWFGKESRLCTS